MRSAGDIPPPSEFDVNSALRAIATTPRLAGSEGAAETAARIRKMFEELGYEVSERTFTFSPLLGRFGLSVAGVLYLAATITATAFLLTDHPFSALALLLLLLVALVTGGFFVRALIDDLPIARQQGTNLFAVRNGVRPRFIIMAHRDTKSQPVPLAFRGPAVILGIVAWLALVVGAVFHTARPLPTPLIVLLGIAAFIAGVILVFCWVDNRSPGALDNGSGVAAALGIAARERATGDVAFIITDAEELGLAGSRAIAGQLPPVHGVINLDGLDDGGEFYVLERFGVMRKKGMAPHLAAAIMQAAAAMGEAAERRDMPFGIPVDHIPIVVGGTPALTVMRGTMASLRRVHRPYDDLDHLRGDGVRKTVELVCGALDRLREQARSLGR